VKKWVFLILVTFSVTLAVVVGKRMSTDAMAVVVGIACGVAASIPTSLLIVAVATRRGERERERRDYPPVVVINPGSSQPQYLQPPYPPLVSQGPRQFRIVGQEEETEVEKRGLF